MNIVQTIIFISDAAKTTDVSFVSCLVLCLSPIKLIMDNVKQRPSNEYTIPEEPIIITFGYTMIDIRLDIMGIMNIMIEENRILRFISFLV